MEEEKLIIGVCLLAGACLFFSLNSFSLGMFSRVKLQEAFKGRKKEAHFDNFLENQEAILMVCSFFGLLSNIGAVILLGVLLEAKGIIWLLISSWLLLETVCVIVPYSWAKYTGEAILAINYRILMFMLFSAKPVIYVFKLHDTLAMRLAGVAQTTPDQEQEERQEELLSVVEQGIMEGVVDEEEMEMIENVLEFSDTSADEIMTPRTDMIALDANKDLQSVLETISNAGHSRIPVYEKNIDNIIGLVYAKDLLAEIGKNPSEFKLREKMRDAYFVPETKPLRDLLHEFQNQKLHIAIVLDEYGGTAGVVTIEDILEELVGEIIDEYEETPTEEINRIDDNTLDIDARLHIDDLNSELDVNLPEEEDYDTVGGFVFSHLGYIPKAGNTFEYKNMMFTIMAAEARRIKRIKIEKLHDNKEEIQ